MAACQRDKVIPKLDWPVQLIDNVPSSDTLNRMTTYSDRIICEHCDSVSPPLKLGKGQTAICRRCSGVLARGRPLGIQQLLALTLTAALLFVAANAFPVIVISLKGLSNQATLLESVAALAQGQISLIAAVAGLTIILAPLLQILLLGWLLSFAVSGRAAPGFRRCMRALEHLRPWSMLEVCLLGILVAIVKLGGMLDVHPGLGLWALAMLTVVLILISGKGIRRLWTDLEGQWK
jgi:paraquat-inducible protein A